jgi:hypothetical protein
MGVLDDAIREHLDLKRRRGADPAEVERDERDALGPVRRSPEDVAVEDRDVDGSDLEAERELERDDELPYVDAETDWDEALAAETKSEAPSSVVDDHELGEPPAHAAPDQEAAPSDSRAGADPRPATPFNHGDDTAEYDVEHELDKEHAGELDEEHGTLKGKDGEDVLEETPDFLQDTPEHDRLWFEQRKPRDFDFDG